jgi:hypothetical protein
MIKIGDTISINNDKWNDCGKKYHVISLSYRENSTGVDLVLKDEDNNIFHHTESLNVIIVEKRND